MAEVLGLLCGLNETFYHAIISDAEQSASETEKQFSSTDHFTNYISFFPRSTAYYYFQLMVS